MRVATLGNILELYFLYVCVFLFAFTTQQSHKTMCLALDLARLVYGG